MNKEDYVGLKVTHTVYWQVRTLLIAAAVGCGFFLTGIATARNDNDPGTLPTSTSRQDITFRDARGNMIPMAEVQRRMIAFNDATRQTLQDLGGNPPQAQKLKVITLNAGLLNTPIIKVPKYTERSQALIPALKNTDFDILCLQEVFYGTDLTHLRRFAMENGYYFYRGGQDARNRNGVVILVKRDLTSARPVFQEHRYHVMAWYERLSGFQKGIISATLQLPGGRKLAITNTHLTAFLEQEHIRAQQLKGMISLIDSLDADYVIVSGDLNVTMEPLPGHEGLNVTQALISRYGLVDSYSVANPGKNEPSVSLVENPTAEFGFSTNMGHTVKERIDFIFAMTKKAGRHILVEDSRRVFTEDLSVKVGPPPPWVFWYQGKKERRVEKNCKLSDHFGVLSAFTLF